MKLRLFQIIALQLLNLFYCKLRAVFIQKYVETTEYKHDHDHIFTYILSRFITLDLFN